jgi:hypothetical protein
MRSITRKRKRAAPAATVAPVRSSAGFTAHISGDVRAAIGGDATFGALPAPEGGSPVFRLLLGPLSAQGCVLLTWTSGSLPVRGIYPIGDGDSSPDRIGGLVLLGPVERPLAELRVESGTLRILAASRRGLVGSFALAAVGWPRNPKQLRISLSGDFRARSTLGPRRPSAGSPRSNP